MKASKFGQSLGPSLYRVSTVEVYKSLNGELCLDISFDFADFTINWILLLAYITFWNHSWADRIKSKIIPKGFEQFRSNLARLLEVPEWNLDNTHARSSVILYIVLFTNTVLGLWPIPKSWVKITQVCAKFEFRYASLKRKFSFIFFVHNLVVGFSAKKNRENYPEKCFGTKESETWIKI